MQITFLSAALPLTKTFLQRDGQLVATPYPHVTRITSWHEDASTLAQFKDLLIANASLGRCLFNGQLTTPLSGESRAGKTLKTPREWVVFDFDKVDADSPAEVVQKYLPAECQNVSYISQLSASMFRPDSKKWSGHIFMLLSAPADEMRIKQWFEWINFNTPALEQQISLADSRQALHWPLDRTAAYNSKLIYIAPPKCHGFKPAITQHITYVKKKRDNVVVGNFTPIDSHTVRTKINALRKDVGDDEITYDVVTMHGNEVLRQSDVCSITGLKASGDHYVRFNLNGGDSYAYFIDLRAPELIRNFKGEPFLRTEDAAPDVWKKLRKAAPNAVAKAPLEEGAEVLAFYDTLHGSAVKIGTYLPVSRKLQMNSASETSARAWLAEYGMVQSAFLPHMEVSFDPTWDEQFVPGDTRINTFKASAYMTMPKTERMSTVADTPPTINRLLRSLLGDPTPEVFAHFINWLSFVFQKREKTGTAWVFSGTEGTGKGSFVKYVLSPLFGPEHVRIVQFGLMKQEFNGYLENALFVVFDEADINAAHNGDEVMAKLRHYITDSPLEIRKMRTDPYSAPNYSNFLFNTNQRTPIIVGTKDRRFNLPERQDMRLHFTPNEIATLQAGTELEAFATMLLHWPVNTAQVIQLIDTQARADVHEATTTINQQIADAIVSGDLQFFVDRMPSEAIAAADFYNRFNPIGMFRKILDDMVDSANTGEPMYLTDNELFPLFRMLVPDVRYFQDSKTWRLRHYKAIGLDVNKQHRAPGSKTLNRRGVRVVWRAADMTENAPKQAVASNVTAIKKRK